MLVFGFIYYFLSTQSSTIPNICTISSGFKCTQFSIESNTISTTLLFFLTNTQQYPIKGTTATLNINSIGLMTAKCLPTLVLPGGDLICSTTSLQTLPNGLSISGLFYVNSSVCTNILAPFSCIQHNTVNYSGTVQSQISGYAPNVCSISLKTTAINLQSNTKYPVNATVKMNGLPIPGATVNFSSSSASISISPPFVNTGSNGNVTTYISSNTATSTTINGVFDTCSNTLQLTFS